MGQKVGPEMGRYMGVQKGGQNDPPFIGRIIGEHCLNGNKKVSENVSKWCKCENVMPPPKIMKSWGSKSESKSESKMTTPKYQGDGI